MAAGLASVRLAKDPTVRASLEKNSDALQRALDPICARAPFPLKFHSFGNMGWLLPLIGFSNSSVGKEPACAGKL